MPGMQIIHENQRGVDPVEKVWSFMERVFGFHHFRLGQEEILESVLDALDTLAIMPTGGEKSFATRFPLLSDRGLHASFLHLLP